MSLPIPIIAGNFEKFHKTQAKKNKLLKRRAAVALAREKEERVIFLSNVFMFHYNLCSVSGETDGDHWEGGSFDTEAQS